LGELRSLPSKKKLLAHTRREMQFLSNKKKDKFNENYVEEETAGARKQFEDAEIAIMQPEGDMNNDEKETINNQKA
jgi:hypothetical protein